MSPILQQCRIADQVTLRPSESVRDTSAVQSAAAPPDHFEILDELGRGGNGIVYLARQAELAERLVVLKFIPRTEGEHLSLARLQHPNIVPLYAIYDASPDQRALCMPFAGSVTLGHLLNEFWETPADRRRASDIAAFLEKARVQQPPNTAKPAGRVFKKDDYVRVICRMGVALAEVLHYAHDQHLVHLDIKPSNVLLTPDGQPMLLDFHLARPPVEAGDATASIGGTARYMAPEQAAACAAIADNVPIPQAVDGRADIFSLGVVLYEALAGCWPFTPAGPLGSGEGRIAPPCEVNRRVSVGLSDIIVRCLAPSPAERYQTAAELARDLRRHLEHQPLLGVPNRSRLERWQKFRRRRPYLLAGTALLVTVVIAVAVSALAAWSNLDQRHKTAEQLSQEGDKHLEKRQFLPAIAAFTDGLDAFAVAGGDPILRKELVEQLRLAEQCERAETLHRFVENMRALSVREALDQRALVVLEVNCRKFWNEGNPFAGGADRPVHGRLESLPRELHERARRDLIELALGWAEIRLHLDVRQSVESRRRESIELLDEAAQRYGPAPALTWMRQRKLGESGDGNELRTAWDYYLVGRASLQMGNTPEAAEYLEKSMQLELADYWSHYCYGVCCVRMGRQRQAIGSFNACIAQRPTDSDSLYQRGRAYAALGEWKYAERDFEKSLSIRPNVSEVLHGLAQAQAALAKQR